jgi:hypothetical protein
MAISNAHRLKITSANFKQRQLRNKNAVFRMRCRVGLVRTDVSEECVASIFRLDRISKLETTLAVTFYIENGGDRFLRNMGPNKALRHHIPEDGILHSHRRGNLKFYAAKKVYSLCVDL